MRNNFVLLGVSNAHSDPVSLVLFALVSSSFFFLAFCVWASHGRPVFSLLLSAAFVFVLG